MPKIIHRRRRFFHDSSITNLRASDATIFNDNTIESSENTFSSGSVEFTGIKGVNTLVLDPNSQFNAETQSVSDDESTSEINKVSSAAASATIILRPTQI